MPTICQALNFHEAGGEHLLERLIHWLSEKTVLLVLDNFEQFTARGNNRRRPAGGCSPTARGRNEPVGTAAARRARVCRSATRAARIRAGSALAGVQLALAIGEYDAVRFFIERARNVRPDFSS